MTKAEIVALQKKLGVKADGIIGPATRAAAKKKGITLPPPVAAVPKPAAKPVAKPVAKPAAKPAPKAAVPAPPKFKPKPAVPAPPKFKPAAKLAPAKPAAAKPATAKAKVAATKAKTAAAKKTAAAAKVQSTLASGQPLTPEVVQEAVSAMPAAAREIAAEQLSTLAATPGASAADLDALVESLAKSIAPELATIKDAMAAKEVTQGATSESNALISEQDRWASTLDMQTKILQAIRDLAVQVVARERVTAKLFKAYGVQA